MFKFIIKTFDQVKNDNFDQVKFDQPTPCLTGAWGGLIIWVNNLFYFNHKFLNDRYLFPKIVKNSCDSNSHLSNSFYKKDN